MTTVYMLVSQSKNPMMSFILKSKEHLCVIDGGNFCDADFLCTYVKSLGGVIDGWFITHAHPRHCNALSSLLERHADEVEIKQLYYNFPSREYFAMKNDEDGRMAIEVSERMYKEVSEHNIPYTIVHKGDVFEFGEMKFTILFEPDESIKSHRVDNSSLVIRVDGNNKSCLFLGDLCYEGGRRLVKTTPRDLLHVDMVQVARHGDGGVGRHVYEAIKADYTLWCLTKPMWENDRGVGYDTGSWKTILTRGWLSDIGIKWHYLSYEGTHEVPFYDMDKLHPQPAWKYED